MDTVKRDNSRELGGGLEATVGLALPDSSWELLKATIKALLT